jgi:hypothetical protein
MRAQDDLGAKHNYLGGKWEPPGRRKQVKPIKMFGLATLAALMAMAFVGAGSAMAEETQLCKVDPGTGAKEACPNGEATTAVHEVSVTKAKLVTSILTVECDVLLESLSVGALARPQIVLGHFTFTNCGSCEVSEKAGTTGQSFS